ncbi:hypothetical protein [Paenibacillus sp. An7]|uniref:hypothetical protein n=1 Tax=Paenibacillus sp. An7 TaxID=2689577 RepID=UPI00135788E8|nr:hypothetical protein [Paenibacillus sp. An7]
MNKKVILSGVICTAVLVGSFTYMYQANAQSFDQSTNLVNESEVAQYDTSLDASFEFVESNAIKNNLPLNLAESNELSKFSKSENKNPIVELFFQNTQDWGTDVAQRVDYKLESNSIISVHQSEYAPQTSVQNTVDYFMNIEVYDPAHLSTQEINGFKAVVSDEPQRKMVHVMGDDFVYTIATVYPDVELNYLLDIAQLIQE